LVNSPRQNLALRERDRWRPPSLEPGRSALGRLGAAVRRFFDLQAGSVWNDVATSVGDARGKVIDVGCGAQPYRALLPVGTTYVGLDVDQAEAHFGYAVPDTIHFDGGSWPAETHDADFVLCTEALEHVLEPRKLLDEAFGALRPGGRILLTVPFAARWHFVPHDYWRFTPSSLKHLLEGTGFRDVVVWARGNEITVACYKVMALLLPLLMPQGAAPAKSLALRLCGLPTVPLFVGLAVIANLSLRGRGGDDCLGYTVTATRPEGPS
jgi:SAM-dependent methyltransferase